MNKGFLKRFTAMMLCLVMVVGMLPMTAGAATEVIAPVSGESYYIGDTTNFIAADGTVTNYENAVAWTATESGEGYILSYGGSYLCAAMDTALNKYVPKVLGDVSAEDVSAGNIINVWLWDADNNSFYYPSGYNQTPNYICLVDGSLAFTEDSTAAVFRAYTDDTQSVTYSEDSSSTASSTSTDEFYRIVHLDCGRKYFSVDSIKALIDNAAAAGYTHLQLAFGNDGLRFLLNDMSISYDTVTLTDNDTTSTSDTMTGYFAEGNASQNASGDSSYLTEADMAAIFEYAEGKIKIIPLLNMPGHMTAIVYAMEELDVSNFGYGSSGSLNITDDTAVGLAKALLQKYINYFKGLGCTLFNIGADEFANDIYSTGSMGFGHLVSTKASDGTTYYAKYFVPFLNDMADIITTAGMTPMAFNDGFYYGGADVSINTFYMVCYWSSGYNDYVPASAATVANKGHKMINTHGDWYYVLKDGDNGQVVNSNASSFSVTDFMGDDPSASQITGAMFCIWCDYPNYPSTTGATDATWSDTTVITNSASYLADTGAAIAKYSSTGTDGGTTDGGTTGGENGEDITPVTKNIVLYIGDDTQSTYTDTISNQYYTTYTESSSGIVNVSLGYEAGTSGGYELYNVTEDSFASGKYLLVNKQTKQILTNVLLENGGNNSNIDGLTAGAVLEGDAITVDYSDYEWTFEASDGGYTVKSSDGKYLNIETSNNGDNNVGLSTDKSKLTVEFYDGAIALKNGGIYLDHFYKTYTPNLVAGWGDGLNSAGTNAQWILYKAASGTPTSTKVIFTAEAEGETTVTVGHVTYNVTVIDPYMDITVNYVVTDEDGVQTTVKTETLKVLEDAATVTLPATISVTVGETTTFYYPTNGRTLNLTAGTTEYTVPVTETTVDLSGAPKLTMEYWITNAIVYIGTDKTNISTAITAAEAFSASGVPVTNFAPETGHKVDDENAEMAYWRTQVLPYADRQTTGGGNDATQKGNIIQYIRYWEHPSDSTQMAWAWSADGVTWTAFDTTDGAADQLVSYYLQVTDVTTEVTTEVVDWGPHPDEGGWVIDLTDGFAVLDFQVVYPSGYTTPSSFPTSKTILLGNSTSGRTIGTIHVEENNPVFMVTKIEIVKGTATGNNSQLNTVTYGDDVEVIWEKGVSTSEPIIESVSFEAKGSTNARLIRYYVDINPEYANLHVHYVNQSTGTEFHSYGISSVELNEDGTAGKAKDTFLGELSNTTTDPATGMISGTPTSPLIIIDTLNAEETVYYSVESFSKVPNMPLVYTSSDLFEFTGTATITADGLDIYFYYTPKEGVSKSSVIDFGLPVEISEDSLGVSGLRIPDGPTMFGSTVNGVYIPGSVLTEADTLLAYQTIGNVEQAFVLNIIPASNVLYEEDFFVSVGSGWSGGGSAVGPQTTPSSSDIYGYDSAYANSVGLSGEKAYTAAVSSKNRTSGALVTDEFYGNAFDLIADCGPTTGMVILLLQDTTAATGAGNSKMAIIDTRFYGNGGNTTLNQVPIAHIMLEEGSYKAYVYANYLSGDAATQTASTLGVMGGGIDLSDLWDVYDWMDSMGIMPEDAEYIYFDDSSPLAGIDRAINAPVAMFALDDGLMTADNDGNQNVVLRQEGTSVSIDGFRVYRSTDNENYKNSAEPNAEYGTQYVNVLEADIAESTGEAKGFYVEDLKQADGDNTKLTITDYKAAEGYPKNELYLNPGASIVLNLDSSITEIHVSARSVTSDAKLASGDKTWDALPNTEMYYPLEITTLTDGTKLVNITNNGEGIMALAFFKLPAAAASAAFLEVDEALAPAAFSLIRRSMEATEPLIPEEDMSGEENDTPAEPEEPVLPDEPEAPEVPGSPDASDEPITPILPSISGDYSMFNPDSMKMQVSESIVDGVKYVTLTIYASTDVEKLTINGTPVWASNYNWVRQGLQDEYRFTKLLVVDIDETAEFNVVAYDKNGKASHPYIIFE